MGCGRGEKHILFPYACNEDHFAAEVPPPSAHETTHRKDWAVLRVTHAQPSSGDSCHDLGVEIANSSQHQLRRLSAVLLLLHMAHARAWPAAGHTKPSVNASEAGEALEDSSSSVGEYGKRRGQKGNGDSGNRTHDLMHWCVRH